MKKEKTLRLKFKWLALPVLFVCCTCTAFAQTEKTRTIEKVFDGKTALWASHQYGDLVLKKGSGSQIKAVLIITVSGKNQDNLQEFLNHFDLEASEAPDNKVDIKTAGIIRNWRSVNGKTTIKLNNGQSYSGIQKFKMTLEIYVPQLRYATLENKYAGIKVEDGTASVIEIKLFDGSVDAPGNFDKLTLDIKYGKGLIGNFTNCSGQLYDSDLTLGNGGDLNLQSKYSGLNVGNLSVLKLDCFDDNYKIGGVSGSTEIKDKYSEFSFSGDLGLVILQLYDSKLKAKNAGSVQVSDSKYTEYSFQEVNALHFDASFDDAVHLAKVGTLSAKESKYTEYLTDGLWKSINFPSSFDDVVKIRTVGGTFEGLVFDGKYTELTVPIPASVKYEIDAYVKYGKLDFPESGMESSIYKEKNDEITLRAKVMGATTGAPKVNIKSYDGVIKLY